LRQCLVPFARRFTTDDIACWEEVINKDIVIVHEWASVGSENQALHYTDFWSWYRSAMEEMIEFEHANRQQ